jgi:hypothetical protein
MKQFILDSGWQTTKYFSNSVEVFCHQALKGAHSSEIKAIYLLSLRMASGEKCGVGPNVGTH